MRVLFLPFDASFAAIAVPKLTLMLLTTEQNSKNQHIQIINQTIINNNNTRT